MTKRKADSAVGRWTVRLEFKPADLWIGAYWDRTTGTTVDDCLDVWVCIIPMLPIHFHRFDGGFMWLDDDEGDQADGTL